MGKANRIKNHQSASFPFNLLMFWIKGYEPQGEQCTTCQKPAEYKVEMYTDPVGMATKTDTTWAQTIDDQMKNKYTNYFTVYNCPSCVNTTYLTRFGNDNIATLMTTVSSVLGNKMPFIVGCIVKNKNDDGYPFIAPGDANSIEMLSKQLKGPILPIKINE